MDENHQDKIESKQAATEDIIWKVNRKSKLFVPKRKMQTGFEGKTLWDWLQLLAVLAIPLVVVLATIGFGWWQVHLADLQHQSDQRLAQQQHDADQQSALDQQRATILQTFIDNIQDLLLNHNLLKSKKTDDVAILARARTVTALEGLDADRASRLLIFLHEAKLIGFVDTHGRTQAAIIDLVNAYLENADLFGADLRGADLRGAFLKNAIFAFAYLDSANLSDTDLADAALHNVFLRGANLNHADLRGADLRRAFLVGAHLRGADLRGADLSDADFYSADLSNVLNLTQQQLDQVFTCVDATLPKGLTCHRTSPP